MLSGPFLTLPTRLRLPAPSPGPCPAPCAAAEAPLAVPRMSGVVRIRQVTPRPVRACRRLLCPAAAIASFPLHRAWQQPGLLACKSTTETPSAGQNLLPDSFLPTCHIPMAFAKLFCAVTVRRHKQALQGSGSGLSGGG